MTTGRLITDIPRWTTHDQEGRKSTQQKKGIVQSGLRNVGGAKAWCYLCSSEHFNGEPCLERAGSKTRNTANYHRCDYCSNPIDPKSKRKQYCSALCRDDAKLQRRRDRQAEASLAKAQT